jgi:hypothetical protein
MFNALFRFWRRWTSPAPPARPGRVCSELAPVTIVESSIERMIEATSSLEAFTCEVAS